MVEPPDQEYEESRRDREEVFSVIDEYLIRFVVPAPGRGRPYEHRCKKTNFEAVAHAVDDLGENGFSLEDLVGWLRLPHSQTAVALAFLKERGCVVTHYRRNYPATSDVYLDAMIEYQQLAANPEE